jgi:hypothetical protein
VATFDERRYHAATMLVKAYRQSQDARWFAGEVKPELVGKGASKRDDFLPNDTSSGVCFALSVWWIIKKANGEDFWTWLPGPGPQVGEIKKLMRAQKAGNDWDFSRFELLRDTIVAKTELEKKSEVLMSEGPFEDDGYHYFSITGTKDGQHFGHGIALKVAFKGECLWFDPNVGENKVADLKSLNVELADLLRRYKVTDMKTYFCCFG